MSAEFFHGEQEGSKAPNKEAEGISRSIERGEQYLLSQIEDGLCPEFHQLAHGPSLAWTTACVGSSLVEIGKVPEALVASLVALEHPDGGWSYNQLVPPDADTSLRVMQLFRKIDFDDKRILQRAENFVLGHQKEDGGFSTFTARAVESLGYSSSAGWTSSHPCVTSLAVNQLSDETAVARAQTYLENQISRFGPESYWWITPRYVAYELGISVESAVDMSDPVDIALKVLTDAKIGRADPDFAVQLIQQQTTTGSFRQNHQFRIPRPSQGMRDLNGREEVVIDQRGILSTCASIVALQRQKELLFT